MMNRYLIGTGYHNSGKPKPVSLPMWYENTLRHARPRDVIVLADSGSFIPPSILGAIKIRLTGDLGSFMAVWRGEKPHKFNGWMGAVLAMAMVAYCDESDFIFKEEDCLAFGPWVDRLYEELGDGGIIFGRKHQGPPWMACSQSLFLVRHSYIPEFCRLILSSPAQNTEAELGESKFMRITAENPAWRQCSFGFDRERPFSTEDPVFYVQQLTVEEVEHLKAAALI